MSDGHRMLNITDIEKRLKDYPEPEEVRAIRHNIINSFDDLEFLEGPHKYFVHNADGTKTELPSVSSMIKMFEPKQDWDAITMNFALKNGLSFDAVKRMWHETNITATNSGTAHHLFGENYNYFMRGKTHLFSPVIQPQYEDGYLIPCAKKQEAAMRYYEDMYAMFYDDTKKTKMYPVMVEAKTYSGKTDRYHFKKNYSGTFDILHSFKNSNGEYVLSVHDFKTNNSLLDGYARNKNKRMLPPFEDFFDEPLGHYTVQLSLYSLNLMQLGYKVVDRVLVWLKDDGTYEKIRLNDVTDRLIEYMENSLKF